MGQFEAWCSYLECDCFCCLFAIIMSVTILILLRLCNLFCSMRQIVASDQRVIDKDHKYSLFDDTIAVVSKGPSLKPSKQANVSHLTEE